MNIYDSNGELDLDAARSAGNALPSASVDPKMQAQQITIAALLDIAESLRPLAAEARDAMQAQESGVRYAPYVDGPPVLEVGDVVYVEGIDAPGEIVGFRDTEGETFADVRIGGDGEEKTGIRAPLRSLHRLVGDEGEEPDPLGGISIIAEEEDDGYTLVDDEPEPSDLTDELDDDFDGDAHTAAEDAVAKLAEAEAKRKAEKKKAKK